MLPRAKMVQKGVTELKKRDLGTKQAKNKTEKPLFLIKKKNNKLKTECQKREKPKTADFECKNRKPDLKSD